MVHGREAQTYVYKQRSRACRRVPTAIITPVPSSCASCGSAGPQTAEHVLGKWLAQIGPDHRPVAHVAAPLNRIGRDRGIRPPFGQTVRDVCSVCNNGWLSNLEGITKRVLTPLILGEPGAVEVADVGAVAAWVHKTALTAMLISSQSDRESGYGLPVTEYHQLYRQRDQACPLPESQFWIGQSYVVGLFSVRVTPLVVSVDGLSEPDQPHGYAMTIVLGQLVLHGVRFTTPSLAVEVSTSPGLPQLWPTTRRVPWPGGIVLTSAGFLGFAGGQGFRLAPEPLQLRPWRPATELATSRSVGHLVETLAICGHHVIFHPNVLVDEDMRGRVYAFTAECACPMTYLVHTEGDGANVKATGIHHDVAERYERLTGAEQSFGHDGGNFRCKRLDLEDGAGEH